MFCRYDAKICWWQDSNLAPLVLEATALPNVLQLLSLFALFDTSYIILSFIRVMNPIFK